MTRNETRNTRKEELKEEAKKLRKTAYAASERLDALRYGECERALDKIWKELEEIKAQETTQSSATYYKKMYEREIERHGETLQKLGATEYRLEQTQEHLDSISELRNS